MEVITPSPLKQKRQSKKETVNYSQKGQKEKQGCSPLIGFILVFGFVVSVYMLLQTPSAAEHPTQAIRSDQPKKQNTLEFEEVIIRNPDGTYRLHPKRSEKLHRDTLNLESSEQYALRATTNKYYPCLSCHYRDSIFYIQVKFGSTEQRLMDKKVVMVILYMVNFYGMNYNFEEQSANV